MCIRDRDEGAAACRSDGNPNPNTDPNHNPNPNPNPTSIFEGQRKRLSIGVEIISLPSILFLDEPTSGLDSETAFECMDAVRDITDQYRTTMVTIHQPSPETFALFDTLLLLSSGKVTYFGPMEQCISYFVGLQYRLWRIPFIENHS